jgi:hypothetical protein
VDYLLITFVLVRGWLWLWKVLVEVEGGQRWKMEDEPKGENKGRMPG